MQTHLKTHPYHTRGFVDEDRDKLASQAYNNEPNTSAGHYRENIKSTTAGGYSSEYFAISDTRSLYGNSPYYNGKSVF
jgi:hypothetical protein